MASIRKIAPCLWFDGQAEDAAKFYTSIFKNSSIRRIARYGKEGREIHGREPGSVMTVQFELSGQPFTALNAGPDFKFNEAISFEVYCETQAELDEYWDKLCAGGDPSAQQCGWLKDKFGVSWQIVPLAMLDMFGEQPSVKSERAMKALLQMKKLDIAALKRAYDG